MKVLIDRKGLQAQWHFEDNERLKAFKTELERCQYSVDSWSPSGLAEDQLKECDVLVITTRWRRLKTTPPEEFDYSEAEVKSIFDFVHNGGGLLLMSNHRPCHEFDAKLAKELELGVSIECTWFEHQQGGRTVLCETALNSEHPIIAAAGEEPVRCIVTNSSCSIRSKRGQWVVSLSSEMVDELTERHPDPDRQFFAHALEINSELSPEKRGRVVTIADSGFIGTDTTTKPGPGLIGQGDNLRFIMNAIRWLGKELG